MSDQTVGLFLYLRTDWRGLNEKDIGLSSQQCSAHWNHRIIDPDYNPNIRNNQLNTDKNTTQEQQIIIWNCYILWSYTWLRIF